MEYLGVPPSPKIGEIKKALLSHCAVKPQDNTKEKLLSLAKDRAAGWSEGETSPFFQTFNAYIDWWYSEHSDTLSRESLLEKAEKWYNATRSKKEAALHNLEAKQEEFKNAGQLKHQGDLILSFGYQLDGSSNFLECEDYESGKTVRLLIDPKKSA